MQSKAKTVSEYLVELTAARRAAIETVRSVILAHLDTGFEEGMQYGMIGYFVPHRIYPAGYHCDPSQPLPFAGLASQKNAMSLYLMCCYGDSATAEWFRKEWGKTGKRLDMGKSCVRFKKVEDLALDVIGELFKRVTAQAYVQQMTAALAKSGRGAATSVKKKSQAKKAVKKIVRKVKAGKKPKRG